VSLRLTTCLGEQFLKTCVGEQYGEPTSWRMALASSTSANHTDLITCLPEQYGEARNLLLIYVRLTTCLIPTLG